jgi:hypothetical protein
LWLPTKRYLIDIQHIQSINQNVSNSQHDWILEDIDELRLSSSKNLQTWLYGAKIISRNNQLNIKQQQRLHRNNSLWQSTKFHRDRVMWSHLGSQMLF